jgi:propanol-preferring alcohol dehydrogenase
VPIICLAAWQGRRVYAFTRKGATAAQTFAGRSARHGRAASDGLPREPLDAAIIFAPVGALVPLALAAVRKGGRVIRDGAHYRFEYADQQSN